MLHWSSHKTNIWGQTYSGQFIFVVILKKIIIRLFIISTSLVRAKRAGVSLFNAIFVLKERGEITLLLFAY